MDVVDENQSRRGTMASSPAARRKVGSTPLTSRVSKVARASPLAERARDAQGMVVESPHQTDGTRNGASKRGRLGGQEADSPRRKTASNLDVMSVLDALASPSTPSGDVALEGQVAGEGDSAASSKKAKRRHHRRLTAESALKGVLDDSISMASEQDSPTHAAAAADTADATADCSAIFDLVDKGSPAPTSASSQLGAAAAASPPPATAATPRARRLSNQKPGHDSLAQVLVEPVSSLPRASVRVSNGEGKEEEEAAPSTNNPAAPTRRVRRPKHSISRNTPPDNWEDLAAPAPEPRQRDNIRPSHQPVFASPAAGAGASDLISSIGGGGDGETGEVGDLFADMSGNGGDPSASERRDSADQGEDGGGGGGDDQEGNSQHTAMNIDAVMAEFGQGGDEEVSGAATGEDRDDQHTAIDMDSVVAGLGRESSGGGGRPERRETADKDGLESLFGSSVGSPAPSSALDHTESPGSGSGSAVGGDGDGAGGRRGFEDATAEVAGVWSALIETPEPAHHKKDKRRETADASNLQGLLCDSPEGGAVVPFPSPLPAANTAARAAEADAEDSSSPAVDPQQQQQQQQGAPSVGPEPSPLGAAAAAAAAVTTPGSERSSATAVSMKGVLELASPPGAGAPPDVRDAAEEEQHAGGVAAATPTPRHGGRFDGSQDGGDGGKDSGRTAGNGSVLGLLDSTPSPVGGLDQAVADGSALRGRTLARMYDSSSGSSSVAAAKDTRRDTCEPGMFEGIVGDLGSSPSGTPASSAGGGDARFGEDADTVPQHASAARPEAASPPAPNSSSPSPSPSPEAVRPTTATQPGSPGAADAVADLPVEAMDQETDTDDDSFDSPGPGGEFERGAGTRAKRKGDRRATASPTLVGKLMGDLDLGSDGEEETDEHRTIDSMETVRASLPEDYGRAPSPQGAAEVPSPATRTPSPPVARRTRSKSPASVQKADTTAAVVGLASPRAATKKRASSSMSASTAAMASACKTAPESARGRLKSCLSSRKRPRGASATTPGDRTSPSPHDPPGLTASAGSVASWAMSPSARPPGAGGGARMTVSDIGLETPRRVIFGAPMAAEFNHTSPSNRLTPMPSRDAKSLFPLEKQQEAETDEDEDTAANSAQLAEWEGVEQPGSWESVEASDSGDGEIFGSFDGFNGGGNLFSPERGAAASRASSPRNRRRESLAIKSPTRKSIAAYSQDVRTMEDPPSPYDSDVDARLRMIANLNASISGPATAETSAAAAAAAAAAPEEPPEEPENRSFSITTSQLHPLNDSDSSLELTGAFSSTVQLKAPATVSAVGARCGGGGGGALGPQTRPAAYIGGVRGGAADADEGEAVGADDGRIELNDSSELEANLHGMSFRSAASPAADSRRISSGSLMSVVSEVEEIEAEVLSQASGEKAQEGEDEGFDEEEEEEEALSPPPSGAAAANGSHGRESTGDGQGQGQGPESTSALGQTWGPSLAFGQGENARLATVVEEMSPNSLLSSDQSQAQSRRWESPGGASTESTFELQADIMDSVHELMGAATAMPPARAPTALSGTAPTSSPRSSFSTPAAVEPRKRRESAGGGRTLTAAASTRGSGQQRRQSVGGPPPSPTVELSGALGSYMGDPDGAAAGGEAAVMPRAGGGGAAAAQASAQGGNGRAGLRRRRRQSSVGGAPPSPTVELEADLMGYIDDPVAQPLAEAAVGGGGSAGGGGSMSRPQSLGSPGEAPAGPSPSGAVAPGDGVEGEAKEEGDGNTKMHGSSADQAAHSSPSPSPSQAAVAAGGAGAPPQAAASAAVRPPLQRLRRASVSAAAAQNGGATQGEEVNHRRRASLQVIMRASRRKSSLAAGPSAVSGGGGSKKPLEKAASRRESAAGNLRRRLSSADSGSGCAGQDVAVAAAVTRPQGEAGGDADQLVPSQGDGGSAVAGGPPSIVEEGCEGMDESMMEDMTGEDLTENVSPLVMDVNDLMKFVAPEMATGEAKAFSSIIVPPGGMFPQERLRDMPDEVIYAMATALNDAAVEMEGGGQWRQENAVRSAEVAWDLHSHAPVLGQIDRAIAEGTESSPTFADLSSRVRGLATQIKAGLERQWGAWEVSVLERMADEAGEVLSKISQSRKTLVKKGDDLEEMVSHAELAENAIMLKTFRDNVRRRTAKTAEKVEEAHSDIAALEAGVAALELQQQEMAAKKAALLEGKARREERTKAVAKRSASVVRLMGLESDGMRLEKEALEMKEKLDMQLGLRLWCQPITLLPDEVVVAYAAPHDRALKHQLKFALDDSSAATGISAIVRDAKMRPSDKGKGMLLPKGGIPDVGGMNSASGRLSRLIFEGEGGLFSGGGVGAAAAGIRGVKSAADVTAQVQKAEWFVGRAYSLLQEVRDLEKKYACTTKALEGHGAGHAGAEGLAVLCVEVANWRSKQKLVRLRFRLSASFSCCVGAPEVEVDIGNLDARVVNEAISKAGGDQAGIMSVTKGVQAAAACM